MNYNFDGNVLTIFAPEGFDDFLKDQDMTTGRV